jgi:hypothetical protein
MISMHQPFFVMPDGSRSPYFKLKTDEKRAVIVQDPYFGFDFESYQVLKEEYSFHSDNQKFISDFMKACERNSSLGRDQVLWASTGYWSIKSGDDLYIGLGAEALNLTLPYIHAGRLVFCLDNNDFCLFIKRNVKNGIPMLIEIDIYASTLYRPWVEILEPLRKTISEMAESQIEKGVDIKTTIVSKTFHDYGQHGLVFPYAISPTANRWIGPSMIQNHFGSFGVDYLFTEAKGGWLKKDFFKPSQCFIFSGSQHQFNDVKVIRGMIVFPFKYRNVRPVFTKELMQYRNLVESFSE